MASTLDITVLVGNGFDLSAGLETSTKKFISSFAREHRNNDGPIGRLARQIETDGPEEWGNFEKKLGEYTAEIESSEEDPVNAALDCKDAIDDALFHFIASEDNRITDDFIEANSAEVIGSVANWYAALQPGEQAAIDGLYSSPYLLNTRFVTFNYTSLLPRLCEKYGTGRHPTPDSAIQTTELQLVGLVQAHGSLGRNPICGVNDATQISSKALAANEDVVLTFIKGKVQDMLASIDVPQAMDAINVADIIIIYGLSLGETDSRWWKAIVTLLKTSTRHRVIIASTEAARARRTVVAFRRFSKELKGKLLQRGGASDEEIRTLSSQIYFIPSEDILQFKETIF